MSFTRLPHPRFSLTAVSILVLILTTGCGTTPPPVRVQNDPWSFDQAPGQVLHTDHYDIYTTIQDPELRAHICLVMELAVAQYQLVAPGTPLVSRPWTGDGASVSAAGPADASTPAFSPMKCYMFATRAEWETFTRQQAGIATATYLKINRGGYTLHDKYVAYNIGESGTLSVAAHEGWHLLVSQHFKGRIPPFLEEGIATMFEDMEWRDGRPTWKLTRNRSRADALKRAVSGNYVYSLEDLSQKHAGNVVAESDSHIEAFYAQNWAFATFMYAAEDGKYRPVMRQLLSDIAHGTVYDPTGFFRDNRMPWNPAGVRPMLEHYFGMNLEAINVEYQKYIRKVAFDDYASQWD